MGAPKLKIPHVNKNQQKIVLTKREAVEKFIVGWRK